jgi:hypothetical protein
MASRAGWPAESRMTSGLAVDQDSQQSRMACREKDGHQNMVSESRIGQKKRWPVGG